MIAIVFVVAQRRRCARLCGALVAAGGNVTGFASYERELVGKRLDLIRQTAPGLRRVLYVPPKLIVQADEVIE